MNKQEFEKFWEDCVIPTFNELSRVDSSLCIREGSADSVCRLYNDIKNSTKKLYMKKGNESVKLDRHKIAACMVKALVLDRPIYRKLDENYSGTEDQFSIANEALAFSVAMSILKAYIKLKVEKKVPEFIKYEKAYSKISQEGFAFPDTIMNVDYKTSVCWAWHHNFVMGFFDLLGTSNLLFMIEQYSVELFSK